MPEKLQPTPSAERVMALDALRGFALLGILLLNIQSFSMIGAAYFNPAAYGDLEGVHRVVWLVTHVFGDLKFMGLFAMMFGAGIVLMSRRAEEQGRKAAGLHFRRTAWLLVIGVLHAYLLWYGDILVWYALCALGVFWFRKCRPVTLVIVGLLCLSVPSMLFSFVGGNLHQMDEEMRQEMAQDWAPEPALVEEELARYRGSWLEQMEHRVPTSLAMHTFVFLAWASWRAGGLMLIGMALLKWGVLTGARARRVYVMLLLLGLAIGVPFILRGVQRNFEAGWSLEFSRFLGSQYNYWSSPCISVAYVGLVMLAVHSRRLTGVVQRLAAVGRMALSNYLLQTLLCTTIFYGHGFGLFGKVERLGQLGIVVAIWILQLAISPLWLRRFRYGPCEWLWRSATYWRWQPLRRLDSDTPEPA